MLVACAAFVLLLRKGYFLRVSNYWNETREELKKCSWPTKDELIDSTTVVMVAILILGAFTVGADFLISMFVHLIT
jgi:preprotein translocase subunit SecE